MNTIRKLPTSLCNQISAGEVIERPANIIKELIENSLDAHATEVHVSIEQGGLQKIEITDNGVGIAKEFLSLALERYATSKINDFSDLYALRTFGFRGEALASIASIAEITLTSAPLQEKNTRDESRYISTHYGIFHAEGYGAPVEGTRILIENLFLNTPVRLKFLKSALTEQKRCIDAILKIALANPHIELSLTVGGRTLYSLPKNQTLLERIIQLWPIEITENLFPFSGKYKSITIHGLSSSPCSTQKRADKILFYVNKRPISDKILLRAVKDAYKNHITTKEYPQIVLFLEIPPDEIDVNVHPAKTEIRFLDESEIIRAVYTVVHSALKEHLPSPLPEMPIASNATNAEHENTHNAILWEKFLQKPILQQHDEIETDITVGRYKQSPQQAIISKTLTEDIVFSQPSECIHKKEVEAPLVLMVAEKSSAKDMYTYIMSLHATYLVYKHNREDTLLIIDQHAGHERILEYTFERNTQYNSQYLTIPMLISIHHSEEERLDTMWEHLHSVGFILKKYSGSIGVLAIPTIVLPTKVQACIKGILLERDDDISRILHKQACTRAIKSGDILSTEDAYSLLEQWLQIPNNTHCPHGRPIAIMINASMLEKLFKRTI